MKCYTLLALVWLTVNTPIALAETEEMAGHTMPMPAAETTTTPPAVSSTSETTVSSAMPTPTADSMQNLLLLMQEMVKMMSSITERLNQVSAATMTTPSSSASMVMSPLQTQKQEMLTLMQKIQQTSDPAVRQKLLQEHQAKMQEVMNSIMMESQMPTMNSASPDMTMKDDMDMADMDMADMKMADMKMKKADMMRGGKKGDMKRHKLMEQRLDGLQELLNQMLQHQALATK